MPSMIWSKVTTIAYEDDWFFISDQMGPADDCVKTSTARS